MAVGVVEYELKTLGNALVEADGQSVVIGDAGVRVLLDAAEPCVRNGVGQIPEVSHISRVPALRAVGVHIHLFLDYDPFAPRTVLADLRQLDFWVLAVIRAHPGVNRSSF